MRLSAHHFVLVLVAVVFLTGVLLQLSVWRNESRRPGLPIEKRLAQLLPPALAGGTTRDEPIATTEEMKKAVGELLNYDDAVFRIYEEPGYRLSVYLAWWRPGRMSPRLVATHTPDVCWPGNGWERDQFAERKLRALSSKLAATGFAGGECRVFTLNGMPEYVVFWHKVGSEMLSYRNGWAPPWWALFDEIWRNGLDLRKEQLFVRISSDKPIESFWNRAELAPLRDSLLKLGLKATSEEHLGRN